MIARHGHVALLSRTMESRLDALQGLLRFGKHFWFEASKEMEPLADPIDNVREDAIA